MIELCGSSDDIPCFEMNKKVYDVIPVKIEKFNRSQGFGLAISGGLDSPNPENGDTSIRVSDVVPDSPADGKVQIDDILEAVNGVSVLNVPHNFAVDLLKNAQRQVFLKIRRLVRESTIPTSSTLNYTKNTSVFHQSDEVNYKEASRIKSKFQEPVSEIINSKAEIPTNITCPSKLLQINLDQNCMSNEINSSYGLYLSTLVYVSAIQPNSLASFANIKVGDIIYKVNHEDVSNIQDLESQLDGTLSKNSSLILDIIRVGNTWWPKNEESRILKEMPIYSVSKKNDWTTSYNDSPQRDQLRSHTRTSEIQKPNSEIDTVMNQSKTIENCGISYAPSKSVKETIKMLMEKSQSKPESFSYHPSWNQNRDVSHKYGKDYESNVPEKSTNQYGFTCEDEKAAEMLENIDQKMERRRRNLSLNKELEFGQNLRHNSPYAPMEPRAFTNPVTKSLIYVSEPADQNDVNKLKEKPSNFGTTEEASRNRSKPLQQWETLNNINTSMNSDLPFHPHHQSQQNNRENVPERKIPINYSPVPNSIATSQTTPRKSNFSQTDPGKVPASTDTKPNRLSRSSSAWDLTGSQQVILTLTPNDFNVGIQIIGGNMNGIFVSAVLPDSPADRAGIQEGDQIFGIDDIDFKNLTREAVILELLKLKPGKYSIITKFKKEAYEKSKFQYGDSFFIRVNFSYLTPISPKELTFRKGEIFHVRDTTQGGVIGSWFATRMSSDMKHLDSGVIPNEYRAQQLLLKEQAQQRGNKDKKYVRRSFGRCSNINMPCYPSQDNLDSRSFDSATFEVPAYDTVVCDKANFPRPVVIIGACADIVRNYLNTNFPDKFSIPVSDKTLNHAGSRDHEGKSKSDNIVTLWQIQDLIQKNKHCLLDITIEGVELLNHIHLAPIIILLKAPSRAFARELRSHLTSLLQKSSRTDQVNRPSGLYNYGIKFERQSPGLISDTVILKSSKESYLFRDVLELIYQNQNKEIWISSQSQSSTNESLKHKHVLVRRGSMSSSGFLTDESEDEETVSFVKSENALKKNSDSAIKFSKDSSPQHKSQEHYVLNDRKNLNSSWINNESTQSLANQFSHSDTQESLQTTSNKTSTQSDVKEVKISQVSFKGALIESQCRSVSLFIPPKALDVPEPGVEIFFRAYLSTVHNDAASRKKCKKIILGPHGVKFNKPVELRFPFSLYENDVVEIKATDNPKDASDRSSILTVFSRHNVYGLIQLSQNTAAFLLDGF